MVCMNLLPFFHKENFPQKPKKSRHQQRRGPQGNPRRNSADRRRRREREDIEKRRDDYKKRREIQKILTLDDAKEQVKRFLLMLGDKKALDSIDLAGYQRVGILLHQEKKLCLWLH